MKKLEVIELEKFTRKTKGYPEMGAADELVFGSEPYTIAFVYSPLGDRVVKGMAPTVLAYIKENLPRSVFYITYWKDGKSRGQCHEPGIIAASG